MFLSEFVWQRKGVVGTSKASSSRAMNYFMRSLYKASWFIRANDWAGIHAAGVHFLRAYKRLAFLSWQLKEARFALMPKLHMCYHVIQTMKGQIQLSGEFCENPMSQAVPMDEDFIGRFCALTRVVSPRARIKRAMERHITQVLLLWIRARRLASRSSLA